MLEPTGPLTMPSAMSRLGRRGAISSVFDDSGETYAIHWIRPMSRGDSCVSSSRMASTSGPRHAAGAVRSLGLHR